MKIAVAGTGYVGLSIATLLAQHNHVVAVDVIPEKVEKINNRISPIQDEYIEKYLKDTSILPCVGEAKEEGNEKSSLYREDLGRVFPHRYPRRCISIQRCRLRHHRSPHQLRPTEELLRYPSY